MNVRTAAIVFLAVGVLAGLAFRQSSADSGAANLETGEHQPAYITVNLPTRGSRIVTVANPRADDDEVFYITDISCAGREAVQLTFYVAVHFPPELGDPDDVAIWIYSVSSDPIKNHIAFKTPLPVISTIDVRNLFNGQRFPVILSGYYSRVQPDITIVNG